MSSKTIVGNNLSGHARLYAAEVHEKNYTQNTQYALINTHDIFSRKRPQSSKERCRHELILTVPSEDRGRIITAKGNAIKGSCKWIEEVQQFKDWLQGHIQFLWVFGGPGKGKTFLSIYIVKNLIRMKSRPNFNTPGKPLVLEYYCDNSDSQRNTALCVLRGLLCQLLDADENLYGLILPDFDTPGQGREGLFSGVHIEKLWRIFLNMLSNLQRQAYLVLDGLDECDEKSIKFIRTKLQELYEGSETEKISTILVSRSTLDEEVRVARPINLDTEFIEEREIDIKLFISDSIAQLSLGLDHRIRLENIFQARANGTYLWIALALSVLKKEPPETLQRILEPRYAIDEWLPVGLDGVYARILLTIPEVERELSAKIVQCLSVAYRPLSEAEITAITGCHEIQVHIQIKKLANLLSHATDGRFQLVHLSLKQYLQRALAFGTLEFAPEMNLSLVHVISFVLDRRLLCGLLDSFLFSAILIVALALLWRNPVCHMLSIFFTDVAASVTLLGVGRSPIAFNFLLRYQKRLIISRFTFRKQELHQQVLGATLHLMKTHFHDKNRYIPNPGTLAAEIKDADLENYIPTVVQYGCQFWIKHLLDSNSELLHQGIIYSFLKDEFLHWLEAMGIMKAVGEAIVSISSLASLISVSSVEALNGDV